MNLGVGRYVAVTLSSRQSLRGYVGAIASDTFALLVDGAAVPADIEFGDVREVRPMPQPGLRWKRSHLKRNVIGAVAVVVLGVVSYTVQGCGHIDAC